MDQNLLSKYFKNQCTTSEKELVESWLLDTNNKAEFDKYVFRKWDTFEVTTNRKTNNKRIWWIAAASLILIAGGSLIGFENSKKEPQQISNHQHQYADSYLAQAPQKTSAPTIDVKSKPQQTIPYENKPIPKKTIATVDSTLQKSVAPSIKSSRLSNFMVNEAAIANLANSMDSSSNQLVLNIKANQASFEDIASILQKRYGILLELCENKNSKNTYTARFERISIPDLLNDMSEKMLFTYTIQDKLVKICFN